MRKEKSLKAANQKKLLTFVVFNLVTATLVLSGYAEFQSALRREAEIDLTLLTRLIGTIVGLPAAGALAVGLLSWLIPKEWKEALVFWQVGARRLPSSEAFTVIAPSDLRIDMVRLARRLGPLPSDSARQSTLWYSAYRKHREEASVIDANSAYLLYREMSATVPFLLVAGTLLGALHGADFTRIAGLAVIIFIEFIAVTLAGRNAGRRLVANVLAIEAGSVEESSKNLVQL